MKKLLLALALLLPSPAFAGVSCSVPFNLQNGTTADASQVMANYNAIIACLANAAAAGANSDITSLTGITTPILPSAGGTPVFYSTSSSTGSANAQTVATTVPNSFTLTQGYTVVFKAGFGNTGAMTLNVHSTGATNVFKTQAGGVVPLASGDIVSGQIVMATYDGTQFEINTVVPLLSRSATAQTFSGGINITSFSQGSFSGGATFTNNCGQGPLQFLTNAGAFTFASPANDGSCDVLVTNGAAAGTITFSGFTVSSNTGDALDTTNTHKFIIHVERINATSTYLVKALQ